MSHDFPIAAPGKVTRVFIVAVIVLLPGLAIGIPALLTTPTAESVGVEIGLLAVIGVLLILLAGALLSGLHRMRVQLADGWLSVRASGYRHRVSIADLELDAARILTLDRTSPWRPRLRTNGIGLPGAAVGHFRGRPWRRKLFCAVTDRSRVLVLPRRDGAKTLVLSVEKPRALLAALQKR